MISVAVAVENFLEETEEIRDLGTWGVVERGKGAPRMTGARAFNSQSNFNSNANANHDQHPSTQPSSSTLQPFASTGLHPGLPSHLNEESSTPQITKTTNNPITTITTLSLCKEQVTYSRGSTEHLDRVFVLCV